MLDLGKPLELETRQYSAAVPQTLPSVHQNVPVVENSMKFESSKTSGPVTVNMRVSRQNQPSKALFNGNRSNVTDDNPIP
ncbi:unnamed protein product [Adineta steineri]|uniref:Uncharacterized protein n=1 Tax=Adineta steineri TaxID=433720 RepID=A0A814GZL8_9BILA|nr:unnamed protein product [Adineta steineri]CAF4052013.1 unnamed protein product [Adineta steineri]